jgi:predicted nucleotidyltransferase
MRKDLTQSKIISLLHDLDKGIKEHCRIIICGGAAAIVGYGLKRETGDIDIFEPIPKNAGFYNAVSQISEQHGLDEKWINDGVKGFADYLSPDYKKRLIPLNEGFENMEVFIISKADFITMKVCAWRESDKADIESIGISESDISIIKENIAYVEKHSPDKAQKAMLVLSELGIHKADPIKANEVKNLAELIQFTSQSRGHEPSLEEIRSWKDKMNLGVKPASIAKTLSKAKEKDKQGKEMDI